jgi:hypothetical protein
MKLPVGTKVHHTGHGNGVIVAYNVSPKNAYLDEHFQDAIQMAGKSGLLQGLIGGFYAGDRYPYVVQFDSGYRNVYSVDDVVMAEVK